MNYLQKMYEDLTCLSVNNNSWGKLVSLLPIMFDDNLSNASDSFFIDDFNLLSYEFDTLHLNYCIVSFYTDKN